MVKTLVAHLDGLKCGKLEQSPSGNTTFRYDEEYRLKDDSTPLSLSMPLAASMHKKRAIVPFLQGLLPDSEQALEAIARRYSVSMRSPFALLGDGTDCTKKTYARRSAFPPTRSINVETEVRDWAQYPA